METMNQDRISHAAHKIGEGASELKDAAVARASDFKNAAVCRVAEMKDTAVARANQYKDAAVSTATDTIEKLGAKTESYVRTQPFKSLFIALGVGMLAGFLLRK